MQSKRGITAGHTGVSGRSLVRKPTVENHTQKREHAKSRGAVSASRGLKYPAIKAQWIFCCRWGDRSALLELRCVPRRLYRAAAAIAIAPSRACIIAAKPGRSSD